MVSLLLFPLKNPVRFYRTDWPSHSCDGRKNPFDPAHSSRAGTSLRQCIAIVGRHLANTGDP